MQQVKLWCVAARSGGVVRVRVRVCARLDEVINYTCVHLASHACVHKRAERQENTTPKRREYVPCT